MKRDELMVINRVVLIAVALGGVCLLGMFLIGSGKLPAAALPIVAFIAIAITHETFYKRRVARALLGIAANALVLVIAGLSLARDRGGVGLWWIIGLASLAILLFGIPLVVSSVDLFKGNYARTSA